MRLKDKIIFGLMLLFLFLIVVSESRQQRINWYPSFAISHKIPYGSYVAYHEAKWFFGDRLQNVRVSPYVFLEKHPDAQGTFVLYNSQINLGKTALNALLHWVKKGNNLFIASLDFEKDLLDSLQLESAYFLNAGFHSNFNQKLRLTLDNPELAPLDSVIFDKKYAAPVIRIKDSVPLKNFKQLGHFIGRDIEDKTNFIDVTYGNGHIMLHSFPYVFTNYFVLKPGNWDYYNGLLSYINLKTPVYWSVNVQNGATAQGIFKYIIENPGFLWAYRLLFAGLLLYIIFEGKRKQRAIPVVQPPKNETLGFTKTIADMYIENKEHKRIALIHIKHFMDYVRHQLHIDTGQHPNILKQKIAQKTKSNLIDVERLFGLIKDVENQQNINTETVLELEKQIEKIKRRES